MSFKKARQEKRMHRYVVNLMRYRTGVTITQAVCQADKFGPSYSGRTVESRESRVETGFQWPVQHRVSRLWLLQPKDQIKRLFSVVR